MKNLKVTAMILAAALSAGTLMACSSDKETNNIVSTVESETVESETSEESVTTESENVESSELTEEQEIDALTEAVLEHITVARVEKIAENGTLEMTLFELPKASEEVVEEATEATGTEVAADVATETAGTEEAELKESATAEETTTSVETTVTEESAMTEETSAFDFASLDLSIFVETEQTETYLTEETEVVQLVEDGVLTEATLSDIQEGDMLVIFTDENEVINIVVYRNVMQEEAAAE